MAGDITRPQRTVDGESRDYGSVEADCRRHQAAPGETDDGMAGARGGDWSQATLNDPGATDNGALRAHGVAADRKRQRMTSGRTGYSALRAREAVAGDTTLPPERSTTDRCSPWGGGGSQAISRRPGVTDDGAPGSRG